MEENDNWVSNIRQESYIHEMNRLKLPIRNGYIQKGRNFDFDGGYVAMKNLMKLEERPTAVFAAGDKCALGAMQAVKDEGFNVPDDISIIGFDDSDVSQYVTPKLTTVKQSCDMIGSEAATILIHQIDKKEKVVVNKIIPVELIVRESCKRIK